MSKRKRKKKPKSRGPTKPRSQIKIKPTKSTASSRGLAIDLSNESATALDNGDMDAAVKAARKAIDADPTFGTGWSNLGIILHRAGDDEEAIRCLRRSIELNPTNPKPFYTITRAGYQLTDEEVDHLFRLAAAATEPNQIFLSHFALSRYYEHRKEWSASFYAASKANKAVDPDFNLGIHRAFIDAIKATFTPEVFESRKGFGHSSNRPIFIVGMPRSGTSLVEQILATHSSVFGGGELVGISRIANELEDYPKNLDALTDDETMKRADTFLRQLPGKDTYARVTDKMPMNFSHLGLIALLFPSAKVIHCRRNPIDTCTSCFLQGFTKNVAFSFDTTKLAVYYNGYREIMDHWSSVLPSQPLVVDYEKMVDSTEDETRRLLEFCELEWEDDCLEFHQTDRIIQTASYDQVRKPIYKSSVDRWRRYGPVLDPITNIIKNEYLEEAGYNNP